MSHSISIISSSPPLKPRLLFWLLNVGRFLRKVKIGIDIFWATHVPFCGSQRRLKFIFPNISISRWHFNFAASKKPKLKIKRSEFSRGESKQTKSVKIEKEIETKFMFTDFSIKGWFCTRWSEKEKARTLFAIRKHTYVLASTGKHGEIIIAICFIALKWNLFLKSNL